ncbi:nucleotidyltransferase domain-containing protein [Peribacillus muralis]|uniref:nucleotidyltransferase domain-containing protein n=1 Tax=Peribacillus muralis TaxID=264697 RepID=UPI001F4E170B|nr:nucleotidyltransferase domain-containing protein [Peribacillus muralis]MCK1995047.1 nucleotidyltransferase domain-containing protein [Peribacillus muralis]MCK2015582.1 nucleotidyltransferase domain-containing protein [Peribacillus muralis]
MPKHRDILLHNAVRDLSDDGDVLAIYLAGSLAKGNFDEYSDIDLHTVVTKEQKAKYIIGKMERANGWGNAAFHEDHHSSSPYIVTHYDTFVKVDSWYHSPEDVVPSIWMKEIEILYDPFTIMKQIVKASADYVYQPSVEEVELWRGKLLAFIHETYRAVMREERLYARANLDKIRWLIVLGWYMEMGEHIDGPYGAWTKIEGKRSKLDGKKLNLLKEWGSDRNGHEIMKTMRDMIPEFLRINECLSIRLDIEGNEVQINRFIKMAT